ncbi:hypothetical protein TTRE_0000879401 [Trichuris trichiura]|uniref:Peptidase A2 domain-containing protein n=1 Tax=Trichuris trichiura TaxID=36087 RepID=A0A077ZNY1_TRITR|nr:hypothetical protein TTRE_0000879401 [Trichuris trichiura]
MWARRSFELRPRPVKLCDLDEWSEETVTIQSGLPSDMQQHSELSAKIITTDNSPLEVNVLLDAGSEATLIREDVANRIGLKGPVQDIRLSTFHGADPLIRCNRVCFTLQSLDGHHKFEIDSALTVPTLSVSRRRVDFKRLKSLWPHLRGIQIAASQPDDITVLVGMDVVEAHGQYRVFKHPKGIDGPHAVLTPFDWFIIE